MATAHVCSNGKRTILSSIYLDILADHENFFPPRFYDLVDHCNNQNIPLVLALDSNAHSCLWGKETNRRGKLLEDVIASYGLNVENIGISPTFEARQTSTVIDITLTLQSPSILNWQVSTEATLSDHNAIRYELELCPEPPCLVPNLAKACLLYTSDAADE